MHVASRTHTQIYTHTLTIKPNQTELTTSSSQEVFQAVQGALSAAHSLLGPRAWTEARLFGLFVCVCSAYARVLSLHTPTDRPPMPSPQNSKKTQLVFAGWGEPTLRWDTVMTVGERLLRSAHEGIKVWVCCQPADVFRVCSVYLCISSPSRPFVPQSSHHVPCSLSLTHTQPQTHQHQLRLNTNGLGSVAQQRPLAPEVAEVFHAVTVAVNTAGAFLCAFLFLRVGAPRLFLYMRVLWVGGGSLGSRVFIC